MCTTAIKIMSVFPVEKWESEHSNFTDSQEIFPVCIIFNNYGWTI